MKLRIAMAKHKNEHVKKLVILRRFGIQTRLTVSFIFLMIVMLMIIGIFSYSSSTKTIDSKIKTNSLQVIKQTSVIIDNKIKNMEAYFNDIGMSSPVQNSLNNYNGGEKEQKLEFLKNLTDILKTKFITTTDIEYCAIYYGDQFQTVSEYNATKLELDKESIAKRDLKQINWSDFNVKKFSGDQVMLGMQKDIKSTKSGNVIAKMVLIPTANCFYNSYNKLDIGTDFTTEKPFPIFVLDSKGGVISSKDKEAFPLRKSNDVSKMVANEIVRDMEKKKELTYEQRKESNLEMNIGGISSLVTYSNISEDKDWYVVSIVPFKYLNSEADALRNNLIIAGFICILIAFALCVIIARSVSEPLDRLSLIMKKAKEGDLTSYIRDFGNDHIGEICGNYNDMISNINALISRVKGASKDVAESANKIADESEATHCSSEQVSLTINQIAKGATNQADEINDSVCHMDKLAEGITCVGDEVLQVIEIANRINSLNKNASKTISTLNTKSAQVRETAGRITLNITELSNSMKEIQKILRIIITIAEQTNLLSLNASIEAARAGEAGRGFGVVANEIKKLAEQSKEFSSNINGIVASIGEKTSITVEEVMNSNTLVNEQIIAVRDTEYLFKTVFTDIEDVLFNISRTQKSVELIMNSKQQVIEAMGNIAAVAEESAATTQEISASSQEQMATADELANHAKNLKQLADTLNIELKKFKIT